MSDDPPQLLVDAGGVGYELTCPLGTPGRAERTGDGEIVLSVHTVLRQDALELFGFASPLERQAFRRLITIAGIGPRLAVAVLSVLPPEELAEVVNREDLVRLTKVPGVGKKTAERILLELRGKVDFALDPRTTTAQATETKARAPEAKLVLALTGLGYKPSEAERAVTQVASEAEGVGDLSDLLRQALRLLGS